MSFGEGNLRDRVDELKAENARLLASLLAVTEGAHADWPALALDWDNTGDERKREWCQWLYEHAAKQDARIGALETRNAGLESLVRDMYESLWVVSETWAYDLYHDRMADLGIGVEWGAMTREDRFEQVKRLIWEADVDLGALATLVAERTAYTADECEAFLVLALRLGVEKLLGGGR